MAVRITLLLCGLTGVGKSTLAQMLAGPGVHVLSCSALVLELAGRPATTDRHEALLAGRRLLAAHSQRWLAQEIAQRTRRRLTVVDGPRPMSMAGLAKRQSAPALLLYLEAPAPELRRRLLARALSKGEAPLVRSPFERPSYRNSTFIDRRLLSRRGPAGQARLASEAVAMLRRRGAQIRSPGRNCAAGRRASAAKA